VVVEWMVLVAVLITSTVTGEGVEVSSMVAPDTVAVTSSTMVEKAVVVPTSSTVARRVLTCVEVWTTVVATVLVITGVVTRQLHAVEITDSA